MSDISQIMGNTTEAEEAARAAQANAPPQPGANEQTIMEAALRFEKVTIEASNRQESMLRQFSQELGNQVERFITHFSPPQTAVATSIPPSASTSSMGVVAPSVQPTWVQSPPNGYNGQAFAPPQQRQDGIIEAVNNQTAAVLQLVAALNARNNNNTPTPTPTQPGA